MQSTVLGRNPKDKLVNWRGSSQQVQRPRILAMPLSVEQVGYRQSNPRDADVLPQSTAFDYSDQRRSDAAAHN